jgi:hypothetical protein
MEAGAVFILVVLLAALAIVGGGVYLIALRLRGKKLGPAGDEVEAPQADRGRATEARTAPEHVEVESEQRARFVGTGRGAARAGSPERARSVGTR